MLAGERHCQNGYIGSGSSMFRLPNRNYLALAQHRCIVGSKEDSERGAPRDVGQASFGWLLLKA